LQSLGAKIEKEDDKYVVEGFGGNPEVPEDVINVGNSGTTLRFGIMTAALGDGCSYLPETGR